MQAAQGYRWGLKAAALLLISTVLSGCGINTIPTLDEQAKAAWGQVQNQYQRRADLIPNLVEVARGYLQHEASTLEAVIQARGQAQGAAAAARVAPTNAGAVGALAVAEGALGASLGRLMVVSERYPELKADATMQSLSEELASTENRVGFARQAFNDQVLEFNNAAQQFPTLIVARLANFTPAAMLESTRSEEERAAPQVKF